MEDKLERQKVQPQPPSDRQCAAANQPGDQLSSSGPSSLYDLKAEQALLGALLGSNGMREAMPSLKADDFFDPLHGQLFEHIDAGIRAGRLVDAMTMRAAFKEHDGLGQIGGAQYFLTLLENAAFLTPHVREYAALVHGFALRRRVVEASREMARRANTDADASAVLMDAERSLADIAIDDDTADAWERLDGIASAAVERALAGDAMGISTGIPALDEAIGGLRRGTVVYLGGASSMGKSVVGAAISKSVAGQAYAVARFDLEMDKTQIGLRSAAAGAWRANDAHNPHYLSATLGRLSETQWGRMRASVKALEGLPIFLDVRGGQTLTQIEARSRRLKRRLARDGKDLAVLVIDHEGLILPDAGEKSDGMASDVVRRTVRLLAMAKALDVCLICLAQLTGEGSHKDGSERLPVMTDLAWGRIKEQCADAVIFVHRSGYYAEQKPEHTRTDADYEAMAANTALLIVAKGRGGKRAQVPVLLDVKSAMLAPDTGPRR